MRFDIKQRLAALLAKCAMALALATGCGAASAALLHVSIDTSGFDASSGYIDFQFGASAGGPLATALLTNMAGFDSTAYIDSWGVTPVTGGYRFRNDTSNDLFHAVAFGGILSFDLEVAGDADPSGGFVSPFTVSAFDEAYAVLGDADPFTGALATFYWIPSPAAGGSGELRVSLSDPNVSVIPEPGTWPQIAAGLAAMAVLARRRRLS